MKNIGVWHSFKILKHYRKNRNKQKNSNINLIYERKILQFVKKHTLKESQ